MSVTNRVMGAIDRLRMRSLSDSTKKSMPLYPAILYIAVFLFVPMVYIVYISFLTYDASTIIGDSFTLNHYIQILTVPYYQGLIWYTTTLGAIVTAITIVFGYPLGYFMAQTTEARRQGLLFLCLVPLMVGIVIRAYGWMIILGTNGLINQLTTAVFGTEVVLLGTRTAIIIALGGVLMPFVALPVYSSLESIDDDLVLAARNLGANKAQAFYKITLPLSFSGIITGGIMVFVLSMSSVATPKLLGGRTDRTLGSLAYDVALADLNWPRAAAIATILSVVTVILIYAAGVKSSSRGEVEQ